MSFINCTPHSVKVLSLDGQATVLELPAPPKGALIPRVSAEVKTVAEVDGIPLTSVQFGEVQDLPTQQEGTYLIVSALVRSALPSRLDLCSPGELVRGTDGQPLGCRGLVVNT